MTEPTDSNSPDQLTTEQKRELLKTLLEKRLRDTSPEFALSHGQRTLWFLHELKPDMSAYNIVIAAEATPGLDVELLQRAFDIVITVRNALDRSRILRSIDFSNSLLKGFAIESLTVMKMSCCSSSPGVGNKSISRLVGSR